MFVAVDRDLPDSSRLYVNFEWPKPEKLAGFTRKYLDLIGCSPDRVTNAKVVGGEQACAR